MNPYARGALIFLITILVPACTLFAQASADTPTPIERFSGNAQPYELHHPVLRIPRSLRVRNYPSPIEIEGLAEELSRPEVLRDYLVQADPLFPDEPQQPRIWNFGGREYDLRYNHDNERMRGFIVEPAGEAPRGTVLIVHQWRGLGDEEKERARMIAKLGYVAFAIDMYGDGVRAENNEEAAELAGKYYADRQLMRGRVQAAIEALRENKKSTETLAALGYCFGGTVVLECARHGFELDAVVSFHGRNG